jgi:hypothetical protein
VRRRRCRPCRGRRRSHVPPSSRVLPGAGAPPAWDRRGRHIGGHRSPAETASNRDRLRPVAERRPAMWPVIPRAGINGSRRLRPAISRGDERGMKETRRSFSSSRREEDADLQGVYGSDGTRTRDLRRDRPSQAPRRLATNSSVRPHLQGFLTHQSARRRMVEPIIQSTFGPRVGHEILPS